MITLIKVDEGPVDIYELRTSELRSWLKDVS